MLMMYASWRGIVNTPLTLPIQTLFFGFRPIPIRHISLTYIQIAIGIRYFKNRRRGSENCQCTISSIGVNIATQRVNYKENIRSIHGFFTSHQSSVLFKRKLKIYQQQKQNQLKMKVFIVSCVLLSVAFAQNVPTSQPSMLQDCFDKDSIACVQTTVCDYLI